MLKFKRETDSAFQGKRMKYTGSDTNGIFTLKYGITADFFEKSYSYSLYFADPDLNNKEVCRGHSKTIRNAKIILERIIQITYKANTPGNAYLLHGLMLGFTSEEEMSHLKKTLPA